MLFFLPFQLLRLLFLADESRHCCCFTIVVTFAVVSAVFVFVVTIQIWLCFIFIQFDNLTVCCFCCLTCMPFYCSIFEVGWLVVVVSICCSFFCNYCLCIRRKTVRVSIIWSLRLSLFGHLMTLFYFYFFNGDFVGSQRMDDHPPWLIIGRVVVVVGGMVHWFFWYGYGIHITGKNRPYFTSVVTSLIHNSNSLF